ncbi:MAG: metal-dependent transcriptional regulator [Promethearchaeota archaeon]
MEEIAPGTLDYQILLEFLFRKIGMRPSDLAKNLSRKHSTINSALKRLESKKLLKWSPYGRIQLLESGAAMVQHVEIHLHLIEVLLVDSLGLEPQGAKIQAMKLAPYFSCDTIKKICDKYHRPVQCPNNHAIIHAPGCHVHDGANIGLNGDGLQGREA